MNKVDQIGGHTTAQKLDLQISAAIGHGAESVRQRVRVVTCGLARLPVHNVAEEEWLVSSLDFWRGLVDLVAGEASGLKIGVGCGGGHEDKIEILGDLPLALRRGLKRAVPWPMPVRRGQVPWSSVDITWCTRVDGRGQRFAITDLGVALDLMAERRLALGETRAC